MKYKNREKEIVGTRHGEGEGREKEKAKRRRRQREGGLASQRTIEVERRESFEWLNGYACQEFESRVESEFKEIKILISSL